MQQEEIGLQHYLEVLWRRKWAIGVVFVITLVLSLIGIALSEPTYVATSTLAVRNQIYYRASMLTFAQGTDAPATTMSGESYIAIINGLPFAEKVADYLLKDALPLDAKEIRASLKPQYQDPDLIVIQATSKNADHAVQIANAAAVVLVEDTKATARRNLMGGRESVVERQEQARKDTTEIGNQIAQFRREMGFINLDNEMQSRREKIASFEQARGEVVTKLGIAEAHRQELLNLAKAGASGDLYLDDPRMDEYRKLQQAASDARTKYTEDHPALKNLNSQIERIESRLKEAIARSGSKLTPETFLTLKEDLAKTDAEIADLQTAIDSWTQQIAEVKTELEGYPEKLARLQGLEAGEAIARESYKTWTNRLEEIDLKSSMITGNADFVDRAVTAIPSMGKKTSAVLALLVSLMLALGMGFLVEFADTTLRSPEEITQTIGLSYLGSIVKLKEPRQMVFADGKPVNQVAEAFTRVYSNIKFAQVESPLRSVLVTSARKGEGKSTTLVNLACAVASAGKRVIIVDTDLRNPSLQRVLGTRYAAGLTSVLAGESTLEDVLKPTHHPGLSLIPSGPIPPNPAELLHSQAMKDVIRDLEERADLVMFDSPPTLLVADAMLLGSELDAAIIVAESGGVSRKAVQQVKESLQVAKARILGVILNKIQESPGAYYNYYSYYKPTRELEEGQAQTTMAWIKGGFGRRRSGSGRT